MSSFKKIYPRGVFHSLNAMMRISPCARNVLLGFIGSILLFLASLGVGWIPDISDFLGYLYWFREESFGQFFSVTALAMGAMLLIFSWLRLGQILSYKADNGQGQRHTVTGMQKIVALWSVPLMFSMPILSRDMHAYIGQGRLMMEGLNPYQDGISSLSNYLILGADQMWTEAPTPYTQIWLYVEQFATWLACLFPANNYIGTGIQVEAAIFIFRLAGLAGIALLAVYVPKIAGLCGVDQSKALWLSAANPLLLLMFIASGHNDSLMTGLAVAGIYYVMKKRGFAGVVLLALSIGIKPITIVTLPFIGLMWAGKNASWPRKFLYWGYTAGVVFGALTFLGIISHTYFGWVKGMATPGASSTSFAPIGVLGFFVYKISSGIGMNGYDAQKFVHNIAHGIAMLIIAWQIFAGKYEQLLQRLTIAFAAVVLLSNVIQPWYIAWLIPLFAMVGIRDDRQVKVMYLISIGLVIFSISDQLDLRRSVFEIRLFSLDLPLERLSTIIALIIAAYLIFFDRNTKKLFSRTKVLGDSIRLERF